VKPFLTVVTVCYNSVGILKDTIESVLSQSVRQYIEYLIIDGASTDGTLELIGSYGDKIDVSVSEKDSGIYDAMNKGVRLAHGEWILFMNAGDVFASSDVVERADLSNRQADLLYGDCLVRYDGFTVLDPGLDVHRLYRKMICSHQSLFARTELLCSRPFDTRYRVCADYDFLCAQYAAGNLFERLDFPVSSTIAGGFSDDAMAVNLREKKEIALKHSRDFRVSFFWIGKSAWVLLKRNLKRLLPRAAVRAALEKKYARQGRRKDRL